MVKINEQIYWGSILIKVYLTDGLEIATLEIVVLWEKLVSSPKTQELNLFDAHLPFSAPTDQVSR